MSDIMERAEQALKGITPGPWKLDVQSQFANGDYSYLIKGSGGDDEPWVAEEVNSLADAEFIAAAPDLIKGLRAEVKQQTRGARQVAHNVAELGRQLVESQRWAAWFAAERDWRDRENSMFDDDLQEHCERVTEKLDTVWRALDYAEQNPYANAALTFRRALTGEDDFL